MAKYYDCIYYSFAFQRILDDSIHKWFGFLEQVQQLHSVAELLEKSLPELSVLPPSFQEKLSQLDKLKV